MNEELELTEDQIILLALFIITVIVSIILTYNQTLKIKKEKTILSDEEALLLSKINRTAILIIFILLFVIDYKLYKYTDNKVNANIQIIGSCINIIGGLLALYTAFNSRTEGIADIENPTF